MSMNLMVKAMNAKVGNPLRKLVLIKLADNANDLGECWPSYQHIADQCEISRRSVIIHVNKLEEMGFLKKKYRKGAEKPNSSNIFTLNFDGAYSSPSESPAPHSESHALPHSESPAPRTSHSFEPVNEPCANTASGDDTGGKKQSEKEKAQTVLDLFNEVCGHVLPKSIALNAKRQRQIQDVCKFKLADGSSPFADYNKDAWRAYFHMILENPWNTGENPSGWVATIDYATRPDTVIKTLEKRYA